MAAKNKILTAVNLSILISLSLFFTLLLVAWHKWPGQYIWGIYSDIDGQFCEWYTRILSIWSKPFSISNLNPFEGMGSLIFPNNIWFNAGALALSLPFSKVTTYLFSYSAYLIELALSVYLLARALNLSFIPALFAAQVFIIFLFPPFSAYTHVGCFFSAAPFDAHLMALINFILVLFIRLGDGPWAANLARVAAIILLFSIAVYSGAMTVLTFIPFNGLLALGILVQHVRHSNDKMRVFAWKASPLILLIIIGAMLDSYSYFINTANYVSRSTMHYDEQARMTLWEYIKFIIAAIKQYDPKSQPQLSLFSINPYYPITAYYIFALVGGILGSFNKKYGWVAISFVFVALLPDICFAIVKPLFPKLFPIDPMHFLFSIYSFYAIFFTICFCEMGRILKRTLKLTPLLNRLNLSGAAFLFIFPFIAVIIYKNALNSPAPPAPVEKTAIIAYLEKSIKLTPGVPFQGYVISYLGAPGGGIRPNLIGITEKQQDSSVYVGARDYLKQHYHNWHMYSDLWQFGIPSLEEYGQWISIPMLAYFNEMLGTPTTFDEHTNFIYSLNYPVLKLLGVRFIITDSVLHDKKLERVMTITKKDAVPLYLYEIKPTNLGNYSPDHIITLNTAPEIFSLFHQPGFDFERMAVVQDNQIPNTLSRADETTFSFDINKVRVHAKSHGDSMVVLPLQYSHCYQIKAQKPDNASVRVVRANLIQTGIFFKNQLDAELVFNFGVVRNSECRRQDVKDIIDLQLKKKV